MTDSDLDELLALAVALTRYYPQASNAEIEMAIETILASLREPGDGALAHPLQQAPMKEANEHDALSDLVTRFSAALLEKLRAAEKKYGWNDGWSNPNWESECHRQLADHVRKGDPRDVAAYAAFCWHHGWRTTAERPSPPMTKIIDPVDSAGMRGANLEAHETNASMLSAMAATVAKPVTAPIPAYVIEALNYIADNSGERGIRDAARDVLDLADKGRES